MLLYVKCYMYKHTRNGSSKEHEIIIVVRPCDLRPLDATKFVLILGAMISSDRD